jgi:hypothetical protein
VIRRVSILALALAACATVQKPGGSTIHQADAALPAATALPEGPEREAYVAAQEREAKGDAPGAAGGYAEVAQGPGAAGWRVPLRQRAAELYLKAQRWDQAADVAEAVVSDAEASEASRAAAARLAATGRLGAAQAAVKAGQLEKLDLGTERKDAARPPPAGWKRFLEAADAYLARAGADPELARTSAERRPSAAELALVAAEVQYAYGDLDDARRRLEATLERWPADPELLEQAIPLYLATFAARGDRAGQADAAERLRQRLEAEAAKAPERRAALAKALEALARARAGARFASGEELLGQGKAADAARAFEGAAEQGGPDAASALHNAAVAWDQAADPARAAAARERIVREHGEAPVAAEATLRLAAFRSRERDHLAAARLYEDYLRRWPQSPSRCLALRNLASELDQASRPAEAGARYVAFGTDPGCAKADPDIAARALVRAGRLFEAQAKTAYEGAAGLEGVSDPEAKGQVSEAKRRLRGM